MSSERARHLEFPQTSRLPKMPDSIQRSIIENLIEAMEHFLGCEITPSVLFELTKTDYRHLLHEVAGDNAMDTLLSQMKRQVELDTDAISIMRGKLHMNEAESLLLLKQFGIRCKNTAREFDPTAQKHIAFIQGAPEDDIRAMTPLEIDNIITELHMHTARDYFAAIAESNEALLQFFRVIDISPIAYYASCGSEGLVSHINRHFDVQTSWEQIQQNGSKEAQCEALGFEPSAIEKHLGASPQEWMSHLDINADDFASIACISPTRVRSAIAKMQTYRKLRPLLNTTNTAVMSAITAMNDRKVLLNRENRASEYQPIDVRDTYVSMRDLQSLEAVLTVTKNTPSITARKHAIESARRMRDKQPDFYLLLSEWTQLYRESEPDELIYRAYGTGIGTHVNTLRASLYHCTNTFGLLQSNGIVRNAMRSAKMHFHRLIGPWLRAKESRKQGFTLDTLRTIMENNRRFAELMASANNNSFDRTRQRTDHTIANAHGDIPLKTVSWRKLRMLGSGPHDPDLRLDQEQETMDKAEEEAKGLYNKSLHMGCMGMQFIDPLWRELDRMNEIHLYPLLQHFQARIILNIIEEEMQRSKQPTEH